VDARDSLPNGLDDLIALAERLHPGLDVLGQLRDFGGARLERGDPLLGERKLRPALLELLRRGLQPVQLILGRLELRGDVALAPARGRAPAAARPSRRPTG
jgi:hypothetical protein